MGNKTRLAPSDRCGLIHTALALCMAATAGCSTPAERADRLAAEAGFTRELRSGAQFQHVVYQHRLDTRHLDELHVYIEGDGTPWIDGEYPAADPTPRNPLALRMMRLDPAPSVYVGRPCYFDLATSAGCHADYWTSRRYSPEVVASMLAVIQHYQQAYAVEAVVLIGYSGGGALAALLAREVQGEPFLVTVAANLDTELWTELRGFAPLEGSLNPLDYREALAPVPQLHLAGLRDDIVPVAVTESYAATLDPALLRYYPGFDHACCWLELWPEVLAEKPWASQTNR